MKLDLNPKDITIEILDEPVENNYNRFLRKVLFDSQKPSETRTSHSAGGFKRHTSSAIDPSTPNDLWQFLEIEEVTA